MQKYPIKKIATTILAGIIIGMPILVSAAGLVPCDGTDCDFNKLMTMVNNIIHFLFYDVAIPLMTLSFVFVGGRLIIYPDKTGEWNKAKDAFQNIGIGLGMMVGAFVLIKFVLSQFLANGFSVDFLLK